MKLQEKDQLDQYLALTLEPKLLKATQSGIIEKGGGHKMAGGFTIKKENIPLFRDFLIKNFKKRPIKHIKRYQFIFGFNNSSQRS